MKRTLVDHIDTFLAALLSPDIELVDAPVDPAVVPADVAPIQSTLEDGTIVEYKALEVNEPILQVLPEGNQPLADGQYVIEKNDVTVLAGIITAVSETPEEVVVVNDEQEVTPVAAGPKEIIEETKRTIKMEVEQEYEAKLTSEINKLKEKYEKQLADLALASQTSGIIQAPVELAPAKPLTAKEYIMQNIAEKKKSI